MAWLLVAVGALMAAAGLYVIGYSALNTRFEEYWTAMTAGSTLVAGGIITVAIGFATRALRDLRAQLSIHPVAVTASPTAAIAPPASLPANEPERLLKRPTEPMPQALQPPPLQQEIAAPSSIATPAPAHEAEPLEPPHTAAAPTSVPVAHELPVAPPEAVPGDLITAAEQYHPGPAHPPEDEFAAAPPPIDDMKPEPPRPVSPRSSEPHQMPDDWLDRAFADLDQELPINAPALRSPVTPYRQDVPVKTEPHPLRPAPSPDPAHAPNRELATAPSVVAAPNSQEPAPAPPPASQPPTSAVIGRYEADGTSYVMYADGSIEAQSSAGVYRFSSMAELKSFIES